LDGRKNFIDFAGNLIPVKKSSDQLSIAFHAFRDNLVSVSVRVRDPSEDPVGRMTFVAEVVRTPRGDAEIPPVCCLNVSLPVYIHCEEGEVGGGMMDDSISSVRGTSLSG